MAAYTNPVWKVLESWNTSAFLVAGVLALGYALLKGLKAYAGLTVITVYDVGAGGFVLLAPVVALLGLYPRLRTGAPRISIGAVVTATVAGLGTVAIMVQLVVRTLTTEGYPEIPGDGPAWPVVVLLVVFVTLALSFLFTAIATSRTEAASRSVAWLLAVPFLAWIGLIVANVIFPSGDYLGLYAYAPVGASLLIIGHRLRTDGIPTDRAGPTADSTVR